MEVALWRVIAFSPFCDEIASVQPMGYVCLRRETLGGCWDWASDLPRLHRVQGSKYLVFSSHGGSQYKAYPLVPLQQKLLPEQSVANLNVAYYTFLYVATLSADFCAAAKAACRHCRSARRGPRCAGCAPDLPALRSLPCVSSCLPLACIRPRFGPGSADRAAKGPKLEEQPAKPKGFSLDDWVVKR